jgi:hypothetical protein
VRSLLSLGHSSFDYAKYFYIVQDIFCEAVKRMIEIGVIFGILGSAAFVLSIYSVIKQRKLERRLKEKERLKNLAKQLKGYTNWHINNILDEIRNPLNDGGLSLSLQDISKEILSKAFDENKEIVNFTTEIKGIELTKPSKEKEQEKTKYFPIEREEDVTNFLERSGRYISVNYEFGGVLFEVESSLFEIPYFLSDLDKLEKEFGDIIEEFKPGLLKNLKDCAEEVFMIAMDSAIHSKEMEVNTKEFTKTDDISLWIYRKVTGSEKLKLHLDKLEELKRELENLRNALITTSYA